MLKLGPVFKELAARTVTEEYGRYKVGEEYVSEGINMPEGFCSWAWTDISNLFFSF
jgi:uncharacterized repeat protein (TIGR04076 family)